MLAAENLDMVTVATSDHRHADLVVDRCERRRKGYFLRKTDGDQRCRCRQDARSNRTERYDSVD